MAVAEFGLHAFPTPPEGSVVVVAPAPSVVVVAAPPQATSPSSRQRRSVCRRQRARLPPAATQALIVSVQVSLHCRRSDTAPARGTSNEKSVSARRLRTSGNLRQDRGTVDLPGPRGRLSRHAEAPSFFIGLSDLECYAVLEVGVSARRTQ